MALIGRRNFVVITGASRGIGQAIAEQFAERSGANSSFLLMATSKERLEATAKSVEEKNQGCHVNTVAVDFGVEHLDLSAVEESVTKLQKISENIDRFVVVHNAGTVGDLSRRSYELDNPDDWQMHFRVNVTAMVQLNCLLYKLLSGKSTNMPIFVNITSLLAIQAFPSFTQYSVSKAARESYFRAFACEAPEVRVLSYSPGPVLTDMHTTVIQNTHDEQVRAMFIDQGAEHTPPQRKALTPAQTAHRMLTYLDLDAYTSGHRIDYFDLEEPAESD